MTYRIAPASTPYTKSVQVMLDKLTPKGDPPLTLFTMLARDDNLNMSFFRSHGMTGGSFIQLEMPLDQNGDETEAERAEAT